MTTVSQALRQALRARPSGNLSGKISENLESKLLSVLKNSSMPLYAFRSMIQNPAFVVFEPWFPSVLILFWALDRSDTDFFNRLVPYGKFVNIGKTYHNPQALESPTCDDGAGRSTTVRCKRSCRWCPVRPKRGSR